MKRIPFDRFSDKRFYYANAPPLNEILNSTSMLNLVFLSS